MKYRSRYKEIFKLKKMLEDENIPFDFTEGFGYDTRLKGLFPDIFDHYQICYPRKGDGQWISVIEGFGSHGGEQDRLEILGGLTPMEKFQGKSEKSPIGFLTAKNVFNRIKNHYEKEGVSRE